MGLIVRQLDNFLTLVTVEGAGHALVSDEPKQNGGSDYGPTPFNLFEAALGT
jgi:uncharacterized OsmC-like protein